MLKHSFLKEYLAEFIGTFALILIGGGAVVANTLTSGGVGLVGIALAHGLTIMAMVYLFAQVSGAHFNPAVTVALAVDNRLPKIKAVAYILCQLAGASVAAFCLSILFSSATPQQLFGFPPVADILAGIRFEALMAFLLVLTVYGVAINKKAPAGFAGIVIGSVIVLDIFFGGTQTGAAINPARFFGPALVNGVNPFSPIYWIGPIVGALVGGLVGKFLFTDGKD